MFYIWICWKPWKLKCWGIFTFIECWICLIIFNYFGSLLCWNHLLLDHIYGSMLGFLDSHNGNVAFCTFCFFPTFLWDLSGNAEHLLRHVTIPRDWMCYLERAASSEALDRSRFGSPFSSPLGSPYLGSRIRPPGTHLSCKFYIWYKNIMLYILYHIYIYAWVCISFLQTFAVIIFMLYQSIIIGIHAHFTTPHL